MSIANFAWASLLVVIGVLSAVWWRRHSRRGLDWIVLAAPLALAASYLSSILFRVSDYQAGCEVFCPGWWGFPTATHVSDGGGSPQFYPLGFVVNAGVYYALILLGSVVVAWIAAAARWPERRPRWRVGFVLLAILLPLACLPLWVSPPAPPLSDAPQRLAVNAARAWRWQLQLRRTSDLRLAVQDVRLHPDGERHRVCFTVYTWFYLPHAQVYIDLEPAGVRATGGGVIPRAASCWVQP